MNSPSLDDGPDTHRFIVTARRSLLADLVAAVAQGAPLLALTGPPGSGKTTLIAALHEELLRRSVHVLRAGRGENRCIDLRALACQLLDKAEADFDAHDIEALFDVMTMRSAPDQKIVLIVDNAELLGADALGYLRLLSSIAMDAMPQIVFVGEPSFWDAAEHPTRADMRELITDRRELELLTEAETRAFAELAMGPSAFGEGAFEALVRHGNGVIGRIAWLLALAKTLKDDWRLEQLNPAAVDTAAARLDAAATATAEGEPADPPLETAATVADPVTATEPARRRPGLAPRLGLALGMAAIGVVVYWQAAVHGGRMVALAGSVFAAGGLMPPLHQVQTAAVPETRSVPAPPTPPDVPAAVEPPVQSAPDQPPRARPSWLLADILDQAVATDPATDAAPGTAAENLPAPSPVEAPVEPTTPTAESMAANGLPEAILPGPGDVAANPEPSPAATAEAADATPAAAAPPPGDGTPPPDPAPADRQASPGYAVADAEPAAAAEGPQDVILPGPGDVAASQEPSPPAIAQADNATRITVAASLPAAGDVPSPQTPAPASAGSGRVAMAAQAAVMPLLSRGDAMMTLGDIAAARLFYERAAGLGSAQGAVSLGKTYDPGFLTAIRATGVTPNRDAAAAWYQKGAALGAPEGGRLLVTLTAGH